MLQIELLRALKPTKSRDFQQFSIASNSNMSHFPTILNRHKKKPKYFLPPPRKKYAILAPKEGRTYESLSAIASRRAHVGSDGFTGVGPNLRELHMW
jgi:hypothetical protein